MNAPSPEEPSTSWEHYSLWKRVKDTTAHLERHFQSTITVSGINATEIYSFGEVLGLTIEEEVVRSLNWLRAEWDPNNEYEDCAFIRQPQTFPDVLLSNQSANEILFGIELKSWYVLSKEGEPSFRFRVNREACTVNDLIMLVPWCLSNVLSGTPVIFKPVVNLARYYCEYRNHWWKNIRETKDSTEIDEPEGVVPYPNARDNISDKPQSDKGNNFGRIARMGLLDEYKSEMDGISLLGIGMSKWRKFFKEQG